MLVRSGTGILPRPMWAIAFFTTTKAKGLALRGPASTAEIVLWCSLNLAVPLASELQATRWPIATSSSSG